jgi:hypothetical protein
VWLARSSKNLRDRATGILNDQRIGIEQWPAQARGQQPAHARFTNTA